MVQCLAFPGSAAHGMQALEGSTFLGGRQHSPESSAVRHCCFVPSSALRPVLLHPVASSLSANQQPARGSCAGPVLLEQAAMLHQHQPSQTSHHHTAVPYHHTAMPVPAPMITTVQKALWFSLGRALQMPQQVSGCRKATTLSAQASATAKGVSHRQKALHAGRQAPLQPCRTTLLLMECH